MRYIYILCVFFVLMLSTVNTHAELQDAPESVVTLTQDDINSHGGKIYNNDTGGFFDGPVTLGSPDQDTIVLFVNGIWNDSEAFKKSREALENALPPSLNGPVYGFYNVSAVEKAGEIAKYKCPLSTGDTKFFANYDIRNLCESSGITVGKAEDIAEAMVQTLSQSMFQSTNYIVAEAVKTLKDTLLNTILAGRKVIIVAHSQGNLFVKAVLRELLDENYGERLSASVGVIMVGSPVNMSSMPGKMLAKYKPLEGYIAEDLCNEHFEVAGIPACDPRGNTSKVWIGNCTDAVAVRLGMEQVYTMVPDLSFSDLSELTVSSYDAIANLEQVLLDTSFVFVDHTNDLHTINVSVSGTSATLTEIPVETAPYCIGDMGELSIADHSFTSAYLTGYTLNWINQAMVDMRNELAYFTYPFQNGDYVITTDNLNVRSTRVADKTYTNLLYTASSGSVGTVYDNGVFQGGYYWYNACFDGQGCGYVASDWPELDRSRSQYLDQGLIGTVDTFAPTNVQVLEKAPTGFLVVSGGLTLPAPDSNDTIEGFGGCTSCSNNAPAQFEMTDGAIFCSTSNTGGNATINWNASSGATSYDVYRDGEEVATGLTATTYTDNAELILGKTYLYFVKAKNANGSRNADNSWYPEISATLCGDPELPAPYDGPVPTIATMGVSELEVGSVRLHELVNPNGVDVDTYFEYGETESLGFSSNMIAQGAGTDDVEFDYPILGLTCGTTYYYRAVGEYFANDTAHVYGDILSFTTPECASSPPSNLVVEHDVANDALVLSWDEPIISHKSVVSVERKIVSDPRPGVALGSWEYLASQGPKHESFSDKWLSPQVGSEYCYRIRTWNVPAGEAGYSDYSNETCITIEGVFVQQVDFPQGPWPETKPDQGIEVVAVGGAGVFNIERRSGNGGYVRVGSADSYGGINWMDADVVSGQEYCYRFEQAGLRSLEACAVYVDVATVGTPVLISVTDTDVPPHGTNSVHLEWDSAVTDQGYYEINRYGTYNGLHQWYGSVVKEGLEADIVKFADMNDTNVCFRIRQNIHGVRSAYSNELCISNTENSVVYDIKPVISLIGGNVTLELGSEYKEAGFTATDYLGRDITSSVTVSGFVNTGLVGTYVLAYNVLDSDGNSATQVVRNVDVVFNTVLVDEARNSATASFIPLSDMNGNGKPEIAFALEDSETIFKVHILDTDTEEELAIVTPVIVQ